MSPRPRSKAQRRRAGRRMRLARSPTSAPWLRSARSRGRASSTSWGRPPGSATDTAARPKKTAGATSARASPRRAPAGLASALRCALPSRSTIRSTRPSPGCGSCARPSPTSTTGLTAGACPPATAPRTSRLRRRPALALTRAAAALGQINLGHFLPDYTAYEELLDVFRLFSPIPILLEAERGYAFSVGDLRREYPGPRASRRILRLEPLQPHGQARPGRGAGRLGARRRESSTARSCFDEFYSHYV